MAQGLDALTQLRDIHAPEAVPFWPPAPGWWLLAGGVVLLAVAAVLAYIRRRRGTALRRGALTELSEIQREFQRHGDALRLTARLSILLRRVAVARDGRVGVAGLSGQAWLRYLDASGQTQAFSQGAGQILITAPYQAQADVDAPALIAAVNGWITRVTFKRP